MAGVGYLSPTYLAGMILRTIFLTAMAVTFGCRSVNAQLNITALGNLSYQAVRSSDLSNLWGYTDEFGNEYALVGVNGANGEPNTGGISVVDVTDPTQPVEVFFANGPNSIWREIKVYNNHAYVTTEAEAGLQIVDLSPLPQSTDLPVTLFIGDGWITSHSLFIDETIGRLYLNGSNRGNGGTIMYDLTQDPEAPVEVGSFDQWYVHDCYARGNLLYNAHISDGFLSIVDVTDPAAPILLGTQATPNNFTHNCWLDDSGQFIFTTDERPNSFLAAYDVSDPTDIQLLDQLQTSPGSQAIIHNTYWLNGYVVQSYYTEGVSIYDVSDPTNIVETGHYDTSPFTGDGFNGAWGVYPYAPSGNLYVSDIEGGLYILGPTYVQACYLEGLVSNALTSVPVNNATISIVGTNAFDVTGFDGNYSTGLATAGTWTLQVDAPGYESLTVPGVQLVNGSTTVQNIALTPLESFAVIGLVLSEADNTPVADAQVSISNDEYTFNVTTDPNGQFTIPTVYAGTYGITAGRWGYRTICTSNVALNTGSAQQTLFLPAGYADDFALDLGWTVEGDAGSGMWERGDPVGTEYGNDASNPGSDVAGDCFGFAYITGNGGGAAGDDDVDDGLTRLTSPEFDLTDISGPWVRYYRWWFNAGGSGNVNDGLTISLDNGNTAVVIESVDESDPGMGSWVLNQVNIADVIAPTSTMRFIVTTADTDPGHLVEAGLDRFEIGENGSFSGMPDEEGLHFGLFPNPSVGGFTVDAHGSEGLVSLVDAQGRSVVPDRRLQNGQAVFTEDLPAGLYFVRITTTDGEVGTVRAMVR